MPPLLERSVARPEAGIVSALVFRHPGEMRA